MGSTVTKGTAQLAVPCSNRHGPTAVAADWYFPDREEVTGLVWLQHGFARRRTNVAGLARAIAVGAGAIVVAPSVSSNAASFSGCWINGTALHQAVAHLFGDGFRALQACADVAADDAGVGKISLPRGFVLAGHSAGGNLATSAAGFTTIVTLDGDRGSEPVVTNLRGVVLLDGVDQGGSMATGLDRLRGDHARPVRTVAAPDSRCNAHGRGTKVLRRERPGQFVGVCLADGTHVDAEGENSGKVARGVWNAHARERVRPSIPRGRVDQGPARWGGDPASPVLHDGRHGHDAADRRRRHHALIE